MTEDGGAVVVVLLSAGEAEALTERIRRAGDDLASLLAEAHDREAWRALGYPSWSAYVAARFTFERRQSYNLVTQGRAMRLLAAEAGKPVVVTIRQAQRIASDPNVVSRVRQLLDSGMEPEAALREATKARPATKVPERRARRVVPSLHGWLRSLREHRERIDVAFESAADDALAYLSHEERREFERAVADLTDFCERWGARLSAPRPAAVVVGEDGEGSW